MLKNWWEPAARCWWRSPRARPGRYSPTSRKYCQRSSDNEKWSVLYGRAPKGECMEKQDRQDEPGEDSPNKSGGFFTLDLSQIDRMVGQGAGAEEVMAFLILARGIGRNQTASTHGANSIANRTGMTNYRAEQALQWLVEHGYITKAAGSADGAKKRMGRWQISHADDAQDVALANALFDGIGRGKNNPPMTRIYNEVRMENHCVTADARIDALMVLLHLYRHHLLADCGGVNPRAGIFRKWEAVHNGNGNKVEDVEGTNASLYEISGSNNTFYLKFAAEALFYIEDEKERSLRFWDAFHNLQKFGFMYEVLQIWSANPDADRKAEPLYTLYVHDRHARESEPYLQTCIHQMALRSGNLSWESLDVETSAILGSGQFRYIAAKKTGGFPIGIYRLRFRAATKDAGKGIAAEHRRVTEWSNAIDKLGRS